MKHPNVQGHGAEEMRLVCYAHLDPSESSIAKVTMQGEKNVRITGIAVCDAGAEGCYLFRCNDSWRVIWDSNAASVANMLTDLKLGFPLTSKHLIFPGSAQQPRR
jgi:hypothetical protein